MFLFYRDDYFLLTSGGIRRSVECIPKIRKVIVSYMGQKKRLWTGKSCAISRIYLERARTADKRPISSVLRTAPGNRRPNDRNSQQRLRQPSFAFSVCIRRDGGLCSENIVRSALYVFARAFEKTYFSRLHTRKCENTISCCTVIPCYYCVHPTAKYPVSFATTRFFLYFATEGQRIGADGKPCLNTT